ncbi:MAG: PilZ domain-containing protein [Acidobacteria bacterium]|nr:PilZ domain-containing protein [Acidobacteriota bacterium]
MEQSSTTLDEHPDVREVRSRPRFFLSKPIEALIASSKALICNLSPGGIGIIHPAPFKIGSDVLIKISSPENEGNVAFRGRLVWSRLSRTVDSSGRFPYISGISVLDDSAAVAGLLGRLIRAHGTRQPASLEAKRQALLEKARRRETPISVAHASRAAQRITPDQALMIQQARNILANNPEVAIKWYDRAKYSLVNRGIIASAERSVPYRREVLVVWEYLEGRLDLDLIASVLDTNAGGLG